jgi:glycosyltransferase involved in cell wall biosynthesis
MVSSMSAPPVRTSVVIPAYRAAPTLGRVLDALAPQLGAERDAVVVISDPADEEARLPLDRWPGVRVLEVPEQAFPGRARNLGAFHCDGELLAFLDADCVPDPEWLDRLEAALEPGFEAVAGAIINGTARSRTGTAEYLLECSEVFARHPRPRRHACGANLLVRRERFIAAGGFREDLRTGEDTVLTFPIAAAGSLAFAADARVAHLNRTRMRPFLINQRRQGVGFGAICRLHPYPNRWVSRGPAVVLAGILRLVALARCLAWNPELIPHAARAAPHLLLGTAAWNVGLVQTRRREIAPAGPVSAPESAPL